MAMKYFLLIVVIMIGQSLSIDPENDPCNKYSQGCDICADYIGCNWCVNVTTNGTVGICVQNYNGISNDCQYVVNARNYCPLLNNLTPVKDKFGQKSITTFSRQVGALITLVFLFFILVCFTFLFCPANCGSYPVWCFACIFGKLNDKIWGVTEEHFDDDFDSLRITNNIGVDPKKFKQDQKININ
eukprot:TRINITY_DN1403_c0_g1_i2.p1 TRINITY_DN1403_c0_g1~~TRINITY_DN1403_c0_g1_i2.p1  ORF type:complete len:186 (+),score=13.44 TRINITY_DN1403_c0_g1_i2:29-586(+)